RRHTRFSRDWSSDVCSSDLEPLDQLLIERYQHGMPLCAEPYRAMAEELGCSEQAVLDSLRRLRERDALSRIGPVFEHSRAGASKIGRASCRGRRELAGGGGA